MRSILGGKICGRCTLVLAVVLLAAPSLSAQNAAQSRIIDGTLVPASQFPAVGMVLNGSILCTGTVVGADRILTAAHCFYDTTTHKKLADPANVVFVLGGINYSAAQILIHPSYDDTMATDHEGNIDMALVVLSAPLTGVTSIPIYRQTVNVGDILTIAGYGDLGTGIGGETTAQPPPGQIATGTFQVDEVTATYLKWIFHPGESNTSRGDSGGPAFTTVGGVQYITAITTGGIGAPSGIPSAFGEKSHDTRLDIALDWLDANIPASTAPNPQNPTPPIPPNPSKTGGYGNLTPVALQPTSIVRQKFTLNFKHASKDTLDISLDCDAFATPPTDDVSVVLGLTTIDTLHMNKKRGKGAGVAVWNTKKAEVRYTLKNADIAPILKPFGVVNDDVQSTVNVTFYLLVGGIKYGDTASFEYRGKLNRSGTGR